LIRHLAIEFRAAFSAATRRSFSVLTLTFGATLMLAGFTGSEPVEARRAVAPIEIPLSIESSAPTQATLDDEFQQPTPTEQEFASWRDVAVRRGDNLSLIFGRTRLDRADLQAILDADTKTSSLRSLFPGQTLSIRTDAQGRLTGLRYTKSPLETSVFTRNGDRFERLDEIRAPSVHRVFRHATLRSSLFEAGKEAGLSNRIVLELANIFSGVIDFALDPRVGDSFSVLYEEQHLDGEKIGEGAIIAAEYINKGESFSAFRHQNANGEVGYFSADGVSMRKAFMLAPLDFTRVSSNFNMRRLHPVMKVVRPHRGVDYAASTGTPVYASGDGKVTASGYSRSNGNYIYVQHDNRFQTRYLHLHKRTVQTGQRVSQGQTIGTVGATGLATGPHLHYEFLVDGVHKNPSTILNSLPRARQLHGRELAAFRKSIAGAATQLATYTNAWEMAVVSAEE
jgi:murein DD-endopeptidase MepM/ murein hydrolase activator NlpD